MSALAAASRLEAMAEGKCAAHVPPCTGPLAPDTATRIPLEELHAEFARCQERYRTEGFGERTATSGGPQRHRRPRKGQYPVQFSPYRMTTRSALRRVVQVDRRAAKDDIKAIESGMHSRADASTYFEEIEVQDRSPGIVVVRARREIASEEESICAPTRRSTACWRRGTSSAGGCGRPLRLLTRRDARHIRTSREL